MSYRLGFWVLAAILAGCVVAGYLILDSYGKSPSDVLYRVLGVSDGIGSWTNTGFLSISIIQLLYYFDFLIMPLTVT